MSCTRENPAHRHANHSRSIWALQRQAAWTIPLSFTAFVGQFGLNYLQLNAAIVMSILPVVIVYMLFQRYFVSGLVSGAVKG